MAHRRSTGRTQRTKAAAILLALTFACLAPGCASRSARAPETPIPNPAPATSSVTPTVPPPADGDPTEPATQTPPAAEPEPEPTPPPPVGPVVGAFSSNSAMTHVRALASDIGLRVGGTEGERRAAAYISGVLKKAGYAPITTTFPLPNGRTSRNVVAVLPGASDLRIVLGAHYDTKGSSPGANDNGTGTAALLEIARELRDEDIAPTVVFVFFGTEEMIDSDPDHHHYGSRFYVRKLSADQKRSIAGMLSVDMIGYGPELRVRTMGLGPQTLRRDLLSYAAEKGVGASYLKDPGKYGWSDHEPFELAGVPAAWIEWRDDPVYHTARDTAGHVSAAKVGVVGKLVLGYVRSLDAAELKALTQ